MTKLSLNPLNQKLYGKTLPIASPLQTLQYLKGLDSGFTRMKELLGIKKEDQLIITSCQEEAIAQVAMSHLFHKVLKEGYNHILVCGVEKASTMLTFESLRPLGCHIETVALSNQGQLTVDVLKAAVNKRTSLLSISWAHPLTGIIQPIHEIAAFCKEHQILLHVDLTHVLGKLFIRCEDYAVDYWTAQVGSKGVLLAPKKVELTSLIHGADTQELRAGSLSFEELKEMTNDLEDLLSQMDHRNLEIAKLRHLFEKRLRQRVPEIKALLTYVEKTANVSTLCFPKVSNEYMLFLLKDQKVEASIGGEGELRLDQLLVKSGISSVDAKSSIAFAFPDDFNEEMLESLIKVLEITYAKARRLTKCLDEASI